MSRNIRNGSTEVIEFKNTNLRGISLDAFIKGKSNNTPITATGGFNLHKIDVGIVLKGRGSDIIIYKGKLLPLLLLQGFYETTFDRYHPLTSANYCEEILKHDKEVKGEYLQPIFIDFGSVINLDKNDVLELTVEVQTDSLKTTTCDDVASYLRCEEVTGVGLEYVTPIFEVYSVNNQQNFIEHSFGDNVEKIAFINLDRKSHTKDDFIIKKFNLKSDRLKIEDTSHRLFVKRLQSMEEGQDNSLRKQSYMFLDNIEVDKASIRIELDESKVAVSKNYIMTKAFIMRKSTFAKADLKASKHANRVKKKLGY